MTFGLLLVIVVAGLLGPVLSSFTRFGPPIVIGEIAAGVLIGHSGFGWLDRSEPVVSFLSKIGFALLMLLLGQHLPLRKLSRGPAVGTGLIAAVVTIAFAGGLAPIVSRLAHLNQPLVIWVLLAGSSAAVVLPIVQQRPANGATDRIIVWVGILDLLSVLAVPVVLRTGSGARVLIGMVLIVAAAAFVAVAGKRAWHSGVWKAVRRRSKEHGWTVDLRVSLVVLFAFAALADRFGVSVMMAGLAAGVVAAELDPPHRELQQVRGLAEGFMVPLFFVVLGARLDLRALVESSANLRLAVLVLVGSTLAHLLTAVIVRLPMAAGLVASAQLGIPAAVVEVGLATGTLQPGQAAAILGAAALSLAVCSGGAMLMGSGLPIGRVPDPL